MDWRGNTGFDKVKENNNPPPQKKNKQKTKKAVMKARRSKNAPFWHH